MIGIVEDWGFGDEEGLVGNEEWDRLPMTLTFMTLLSMLISEFVHNKIGNLLLVPFLMLGISSITVWIIFKDLLFYALVQFYPMLAIPVTLLFFRSNTNKAYWLLLFAYILAKLLEHFDKEVHGILKVISRHALKHIVAATGVYGFLYLSEKKKKYYLRGRFNRINEAKENTGPYSDVTLRNCRSLFTKHRFIKTRFKKCQE